MFVRSGCSVKEAVTCKSFMILPTRRRGQRGRAAGNDRAALRLGRLLHRHGGIVRGRRAAHDAHGQPEELQPARGAGPGQGGLMALAEFAGPS